ncbi:MAG: hypothetical protein AB9900_03860 [Humidesulfovibrio sp.]
MSAPIRSASQSPLAAPRPLVQSRRVSLRVGRFGLTYSTDRVLWSADAAPATDATPVAPAPAVESGRPDPEPETSTFPLDLEAARRRNLWAAAQERAARQLTPEADAQRPAPEQAPGRPAGRISIQNIGSGPVEPGQARPDSAQTDTAQRDTASAGGQAAQTGQAGQTGQTGQTGQASPLAQAMRQASQAYLACAARFACPRPMLQAVA